MPERQPVDPFMMGGGPTGETQTPRDLIARALSQRLMPEVEPRPATDPTSTLRGLYNALVPQTGGDMLTEALMGAVPPLRGARTLGRMAPSQADPASEFGRAIADAMETGARRPSQFGAGRGRPSMGSREMERDSVSLIIDAMGGDPNDPTLRQLITRKAQSSANPEGGFFLE